MQQFLNVLIGIYHEFLLLYYCCVLLEITLTTTAAIVLLFYALPPVCFTIIISVNVQALGQSWQSQCSRIYTWSIPEKKGAGESITRICQISLSTKHVLPLDLSLVAPFIAKHGFTHSIDLYRVIQYSSSCGKIVLSCLVRGKIRILLVSYEMIYRKISNIRRTKFLNLNASRLVLSLSLPNPVKPCVRSRMKM